MTRTVAGATDHGWSHSMAMQKHTYTDKQKTEALELYKQHGPGEASRRTGISRGTISSWGRRAGLVSRRREETRAATAAAREAWAARRAEVANELGDLAAELIGKMRTAAPKYVDNLGRALNVTIEKAELLSGFATERRENIPAAELAQRTRQIRDELAERRQRAGG